MTPHDQYAAAAIQGLLARGDFPVADVPAEAAAVADAMAAEACKRWGHHFDYDRSESPPCVRCGERLIVKCDDCQRPKGSGPGSCDCVPF